MKTLALFFLSAVAAFAGTTNYETIENLPTISAPGLYPNDVLPLYHNTGSAFSVVQLPILDFQLAMTNAATSVASQIVSNNFSTNVFSWKQLSDSAGKWVFANDSSNSLIISNTASDFILAITTNGTVTLQNSNNPSFPFDFQVDQSTFGSQGDGTLGNDILHVNGQTAIMELGGTGNNYWAQQYGPLPAWLFVKNNAYGNFSEDDLQIIPHVNSSLILPTLDGWAVEIQSNGVMNVYSNINNQGSISTIGNLDAESATITNTIYSGTGQGQPAFVNNLSGYGAEGGYVLLSGYENVLDIADSGGHDCFIDWQVIGSSPIHEGLNYTPFPGNGQMQVNAWAVGSSAANPFSQIGLYCNPDGTSGANTNFYEQNGAGDYATGALNFGAGGCTNNTQKDFMLVGVDGTFFLTNLVTHWGAPVMNGVTSAIEIPLTPNMAIVGSGCSENTNYPY